MKKVISLYKLLINCAKYIKQVTNAIQDSEYLTMTCTNWNSDWQAPTADTPYAMLCGQFLIIYFHAKKKTAVTIGDTSTTNITDQKPCTVTITHNGKIRSLRGIGAVSGGYGPPAGWGWTGYANDGTNISFQPVLAAITQNYGGSTSENDCRYVVPVMLNETKF